MIHSKCWKACILTFFLVLTSTCFGDALGQETKIVVAEPLKLLCIYADSKGVSHFGFTDVPFELTDFAPPAPPISVSKALATEGVIFISSPAGWYGDWHPAPRKQLMFCLNGELEVTVSDGETRRLGPGCAILVEDTSGKGHISKVVGSDRCIMAAVPLK